ncbi:CRISPR-associated endonuclease Cas2 [Thiocystis violacea]|uniref:CRISPR-associated endonuclease Cas2 n=1 Tax=Thiocystis violacea TaxID=13725 RepID=UPI001908669A|nr:CRISPR-associated endonuclease Cas2 [Thiocystis violacea]MBK1717846.1 CRISPR-associated endonuclease Cas2 [Thiocystis violacea]
MFTLISYDVPAERTRIFHKILSRYLMRLQFSVFCGDLRQSDYLKLLKDLKSARTTDDRLMILRTANRRNIEMEIHHDDIEESYESHIRGMVL